MKYQAWILFGCIIINALATCSGATPLVPLQIATIRNDSIKVPASTRYQHAGLLRSLFIGSNYRKEWGTPVTMAVFHLSQMGMKIKELGGGQQTKSLRLADRQGTEWVLRTIDKDVEKAVPEKLRNTLAEKIVQDLISAAYPYAPLVVAQLAKAVQVPAPDPKLYYVPDDPAFGPYQSLFAHQICYLERRDPTLDGSDSKSSESLLNALRTAKQALILQQEVLRARLLDMLIADWDRHADQWRWGVKDSAGVKYYYAIPRDRDQAFFMARGLIPRVGKAVAMQHLNWFKKEMKGLSKLNYKSWEFDHLYLNDLDAAEWEAITRTFIASIPDEVIDAAIEKIPEAIYEISGKEIGRRLKSRRNDMLGSVLRYYREIAREVQVWGTTSAELFAVGTYRGKLQVQVFSLDNNGGKGLLRYDRIFDLKDTKVLHLEGLGGEDRFEIKKLPGRYPKLHLYGDAETAVFALPKESTSKIQVHTGKARVNVDTDKLAGKGEN